MNMIKKNIIEEVLSETEYLFSASIGNLKLLK